MNKGDFIKKVAKTLRENKATKYISIPRRTFTISDEDGRSSVFTVRSSDKEVMYTVEDVETIIDCCCMVLEDCLKHGEPVSFHGLGSLSLKYRIPKMVKVPDTGEWVEIPGHYAPKFTCGSIFRMAAKIYEESLNDNISELPTPIYDEYEQPDDEDGDE